MAMVKYSVFTRWINPITKNGITNVNSKSYKELKYLKDYNSKIDTVQQASDTAVQNSPTNEKFNMLFYYTGTLTVNDYISSNLSVGTSYDAATISIISDSFEQCIGDPWILYATKYSFKSALEIAKTLVRKVGIDNVKVVKEVPLKEYIDVE